MIEEIELVLKILYQINAQDQDLVGSVMNFTQPLKMAQQHTVNFS